jgi:mannosylglycerate hydrolase
VPRQVSIVPHTHWDREWYWPFERFRMRLVDLLDDLLPRLEADPAYAHFMLDGQMAVVDDYLEIRPEAEGVLHRLTAAGRLSMGPWYVLMDEFLVSGETIVRDLQMGLRRAADFGAAMEVGYLPDMFGHVAQMPQILRQAGLAHAVVWRGVPAAIDRSAFWWHGLDGSVVRAEYLPEGYGNGASLPDTGPELVEMIRRFDQTHGEVLTGPILWMNGTDHLMPQPRLTRLVAEANAAQDDYELVITGLADHVAAGPVDGLPEWRGELRSGARANLLMGVASNRVDVKQAAARAERTLERMAEPLSALFLPAERWPRAFLERAWRQVVLDAAHDSSCACSVDEVVDAVLARHADATDIADGLVERAVDALAHSIAEPGPTIVNPSARPRVGLVELGLADDRPPEGTQQLSVGGGTRTVDGITRRDCVQVVQRALDEHPNMHRADVTVDAGGALRVVIEHDPAARDRRYAGPLKADVTALAEAEPDGPAVVEITAPPSQRVLARVAVPAFGWARWEPAPIEVDPVTVTVTPDGGAAMDNGVTRVEIDPRDGTFSLAALRGAGRHTTGLGRLVDDGDAGDTYNWSPPADHPATVVDQPDAVVVRTVEHGPLRGRLEVRRTYRLPEEIVDGRRVGEVTTEVVTTLELAAGSGLVVVTTELDNRSRDHRLRAWLPLPDRATRSEAECAFAVVSRGTVAEGGPTERPLATYPSRRFVAAGGLLVVHEGLLEYELVDLDDLDDQAPEPTAGALALTLLRCTGMLSNGPTTMRPLPAGPEVATPGAQVQGPRTLRYGLALLPDDETALADGAFRFVDELSLPLLTTWATGDGHRPPTGSALSVEGAEVSAVLRDDDGRLLVRLFEATGSTTEARVHDRRGRRVDLRGAELAPFTGELVLGPWEIATLRVDDST